MSLDWIRTRAALSAALAPIALAGACGRDAPTAPTARDLQPAAATVIVETHEVKGSLATGTLALPPSLAGLLAPANGW